jgi:hypothetical protein
LKEKAEQMKTCKHWLIAGIIFVLSFVTVNSYGSQFGVTSPTAGQVLFKGNTHDIVWARPQGNVDKLFIMLYLRNDGNPNAKWIIASGVDKNITSYKWKVGTDKDGNAVPLGAGYYIDVRYCSSPLMTGGSPLPFFMGKSGLFSIQIPSVNQTSPSNAASKPNVFTVTPKPVKK